MGFAVIFERPATLGPALVLLAAQYAISLEIEGETLDRAAYVYAALFLVAAELAYWSLELVVVRPAGGILLRRLAAVLLVAVAGLVLAFLVLAASGVGSGGAALTAFGVTAAVGTLGTVALVARRTAD
jgi:hypothetical protein